LSVLNGCIFLLLIAGHTELWVAYVNRIHGLKIRTVILHRMRRIHDVMVVAFPFALVWFVGLTGPRLLLGGSWSDLSPAWRFYLFLCVLGLIGLLYGIVRWQSWFTPRCLKSIRSSVCDYSNLPTGRPIGDGPHARMINWPGNQQLQLEITEKHFELEMPDAWDDAAEISILHISDWHFIGTPDLPYYNQLVEDANKLAADMVVFTGDLIDRDDLIEWIPKTLGQLRAPLGCYSILGNHDWDCDLDAIRRCLQDIGWNDVAGSTTTIEHAGRSILLGGSELPWMGPAPDFSSAGSDQLRILLSHFPDNLNWARDRRIHIMLSGHNHGGQVILPVIGPVYTPGLTGVKYSHGEFYSDPTLLHVSRGVGGRHPLRWNCRPEITKLVIRPAQG
jgi:predicted MPP superfamily phosphohydrolase